MVVEGWKKMGMKRGSVPREDGMGKEGNGMLRSDKMSLNE